MATDRLSFERLYGSRKMGALAALGFGGGVPNILVTTGAVAWATQSGWSVAHIATLAALCGLPYAFKFAWAPLLDRFDLPLFAALGHRRGWMLAALLTCAAFMLCAAALSPGATLEDGALWAGAVVLLAFASATYDIVADAYRADILTPEELGAGATSFVSAYRIGLVVVGSAVLALPDSAGWTVAWLASGAGLAVAVFGTLWAREPARQVPCGESIYIAPVRALWQVWGWRIIALAAFVFLFKAPDLMGKTLSLPFLMKGMHFDLPSISVLLQTLGIGCTIVGAIIGGFLVARIGLVRCLWIFGVLQALTNLGYLGLALAAESGGLVPVPDQFGGGTERVLVLAVVLVVENLAAGMVASGFVAFLMSLCDKRHSAAQYALLTAVVALGGSFAAMCLTMPQLGEAWSQKFAWSVAAGLPGLALIWFVTSYRTAAERGQSRTTALA